jgi:hypothetical protein
MFFTLTISADGYMRTESQTFSFGDSSAYYHDWTYVRTVNLLEANSGIGMGYIKLNWTVDSYPYSGGYVERVRLYRDNQYYEYAVGSSQSQLAIYDFSGVSMGHVWKVQFLVNGSWITRVTSSITFYGIGVAEEVIDDPIVY